MISSSRLPPLESPSPPSFPAGEGPTVCGRPPCTQMEPVLPNTRIANLLTVRAAANCLRLVRRNGGQTLYLRSKNVSSPPTQSSEQKVPLRRYRSSGQATADEGAVLALHLTVFTNLATAQPNRLRCRRVLLRAEKVKRYVALLTDYPAIVRNGGYVEKLAGSELHQ